MARPRQVSDDAILEVARACFIAHGAGVSTSHIASEIGVSQAALFKRFGTKENLMIRALMPSEHIPWLDRVEAGPTSEPVPEQLERISLEGLEFVREMLPRLMVLKASSVDHIVMVRRMPDPPPRRALRVLRLWFAELHGAGRVHCPEPAVAATQFWGAIHGRVFLQHMFNASVGPSDDRAYIAAFVQTLWHGLTPPETS